MTKMKKSIICLATGLLLIYGQAHSEILTSSALMTPRDIKNSIFSNVSLMNQTGQSVTLNTLFIASFDINDCSSCFGGVVSGDNLGGAVVGPVVFNKNQSIPIGQNFLYNMLYNGIYYIKTVVGSSPCSLPGCSWPGDDPSVKGWCITLNGTSLNSGYTSSSYTNGSHPPANTPPYSAAGSSNAFHYNYDVINPATLGTGNACIGPIVCNDKTLTCKVNVAQSESFQPY